MLSRQISSNLPMASLGLPGTKFLICDTVLPPSIVQLSCVHISLRSPISLLYPAFPSSTARRPITYSWLPPNAIASRVCSDEWQSL